MRLRVALRQNQFAVTCEIRAPRLRNAGQLKRRKRDVIRLQDIVQTFCVTSHPGRLPPREFVRKLRRATDVGFAIPVTGCGLCAREIEDLFCNLNSLQPEVVLCLTGDNADHAPSAMNSVQLLRLLKRKDWSPPRPLFGAAINLQSASSELELARAEQKAHAGAEIFFSQALLENNVDVLHAMRARPALRDIPVIIGIPLVGSMVGLNALASLPDIDRDSTFFRHFEGVDDMRAVGTQIAAERACFARSLRPLGIAGIHIMPIGVPVQDVEVWIHAIRRLIECNGPE